MYVMSTGRAPFTATSYNALVKQKRSGIYNFGMDADCISKSAKELIHGLMQPHTDKRLTAKQAIDHEWLLEFSPSPTSVQLQDSFVDHFKAYQKENTLKKATLNIIAGQMHSDDLTALRMVFSQLDCNGDGKLSLEDLRISLERSGLEGTELDLRQIMVSVGAESSGVIEWTPFLAAALDHPKYLTRDACWAAFNVFDRYGAGAISLEELAHVLFDSRRYGQRRSRAKAIVLLQEIDAKKDCNIGFEQFMEIILSSIGVESALADMFVNSLAEVEEQIALKWKNMDTSVHVEKQIPVPQPQKETP